MDPRSKKPMDFVAVFKNMTESVRKMKAQQMNWLRKHEWLLDEYSSLQKDAEQLCLEKQMAKSTDPTIEDKRTCLPMPTTVNTEYGWLASKPDFQLEKYGSYIIKYPDPMDKIVHLPGDIPVLAAGKGFLSQL